mmetsp:Transcript_11954/g.16536  ORF Transcript_11954/g.16536 Transcript_11954/m.16536 type:complete len:150 (-) Transcript_11954:239-688(-)|eukprot:CAMPEP_0185729494 /NCGR_PEP_ID=MMETSP1171-20130828/6200_1 /TAXON_ID=374046 /ORGANISM="Helicotheca tamensis, Strain CCMP826" /LENGTH=149 /DNA_ID=CAMNT_0028398349 /DNA_START=158 /DNA_END=607 /DNA_ORIENTATION=+
MYGSGQPLWGKGDKKEGNGGGQLNNRHQGQSYQKGTSGYQPPVVGNAYAEQQTGVMEDTMKTHYEAEGTAATVLSQMTTQRYQLQGAHDNVHEMRETTAKAKQNLEELRTKMLKKKRKLQAIAAVLAIADIFLFFRLLYCGGSFFCRSW